MAHKMGMGEFHKPMWTESRMGLLKIFTAVMDGVDPH